ncbi:MAG: ParB/RepB/Spo0J family partition protein [Anaerolineales bacterium]|nr:ParB/RepB/Spo0J family partition protein [Anaerolineales bacterium]
MTRRRGLGKGLDALLPAPSGEVSPAGAMPEVPLDEIRPNPRQPRAPVDPEELKELAASIRQHGVLQPLIVSRLEPGGGYLLIAGQRRLEAARLAGLTTVPVIIRQADERQHLELALIENLQREDLNPLEAAEGFRQLAEDFGLSHDQVATLVGKSRTAVSNTLRLLKLAPAVQEALRGEEISEGHARALLGLPSIQAQSASLQTVIRRALNVRQTEELVRRLTGQRRTSPARSRHTPEESDLEAQLRQSLGTRVSLRRGQRGGSLVIHFYSDEELNALVDRLLAET